MSGLFFENAAVLAPAHPNRSDVACFIGFVSRRKGAALSADTLAELRAGGWVDGPWRSDAAAVETLQQLPVTVESWGAFDRLFAWEQRLLSDGQEARCASYLGAAVRSFFATGGRRAVIIRVGDPWAYVESDAQRLEQRQGRLDKLLPGNSAALLPLDRYDPRTWQGIQHIYGLPQIAMVCLPDLPGLLSASPVRIPTVVDIPASAEVFVECSADEPPLPVDGGLRMLSAPRCDDDGFKLWASSIRKMREFLKYNRPDVMLVGAIPLPHLDASVNRVKAEADMLGFLQGLGVLDLSVTDAKLPVADINGPLPSTFSQLAYPWLRTFRSGDLPEGMEPPDGLFAGLVAANALRRGTFRSVAGSLLPDVVELKPVPAWGSGPDSPAQQLAARICLFAPEPGGVALQSDVTCSPDTAWQPGGVRRLVASVLRAARDAGNDYVFEANGPQLWARVRRGMEELLTGFWRQGGLGGVTANDAFKVRCDRCTMSQNDLDSGRIIVEIVLLPVASVERITVVLNLLGGRNVQSSIREVA
ncbi:MAG: phage tail protein [Proteobacteria bacterium]|nr:phage tail protein [Pseudomonadota bacterium]